MNRSSNRPTELFSTWLTALGGLLIALGLGTIATAIVSPAKVGFILAWVFLIGGVIRFVQALQLVPKRGRWLQLSTGILYGLASGVLFTGLIRQYLSLSVILGAVLLVEGLLEVSIFRQLKPDPARNTVLLSGVISLGLGCFFLLNWGLAAIWLLGLLVGVSIIASGLWFLVISFQAKNTEKY